MDRIITSREDGITWIAELLGSIATRDDAALAWDWGRDHGLIDHDGRAFVISPDFDVLEAFEAAQPRYVVEADTGTGQAAYITWDDQCLPRFTFEQPQGMFLWHAEQLHRDALRTCGGTLRIVEVAA
jgi:hypothetical protein